MRDDSQRRILPTDLDISIEVVVCGDVLSVHQTPGKPPGQLAFDLGQPGAKPDLTVVIRKAGRSRAIYIDGVRSVH